MYDKEINKRRTFAIISHPDAGKTTLTEKLLLHGGELSLLVRLYLGVGAANALLLGGRCCVEVDRPCLGDCDVGVFDVFFHGSKGFEGLRINVLSGHGPRHRRCRSR